MDTIKDVPTEFQGQPDFLDNISRKIVNEVWLYPKREEIDAVLEAEVAGSAGWCICNEEGVYISCTTDTEYVKYKVVYNSK